MKLTPEQQAVVNGTHEGHDLKVTAVAGSGKSTTVFQAARAIRSRRQGHRGPGKGIYLVYNKAAQLDAKKKAPRNLECSTISALAYASMGREVRHLIDNNKYVSGAATAQLLGLSGGMSFSGTRVMKKTLGSLASATIDQFCYTSADNIMPKHVPPHPTLSAEENKALAEKVAPLARKIWKDLLKNPDTKHKYNLEIMLKMWAMRRPRLDFDTIMIDEAQDSNDLVLSLLMRQEAQKIAVGDSSQSLYEWRGAKDILDVWPGKELTLSQSWRFGEAIAEEANLWLPHAGGRVKVIGNPAINSRVVTGEVAPYDAILCRSNAMCMQIVMDLLDNGLTPAIAGGTKQLKNFVGAAIDLKTKGETDHPDLYIFSDWEELVMYADDTEGELKTLVKLVNRYGPNRLMRALCLCADEGSPEADTVVSTGHKSKGREWDTVRIATDFENPLEKDDVTGEEAGGDFEELETERPVPTGSLLDRPDAMLGYVAVTRAAKVLDNEGVAWIRDIPLPGAETAA